MNKVALISTYLPTKCGIASYSHGLINCLLKNSSDFDIQEIELNISENDKISPKRKVIEEADKESFLNICGYLNSNAVDIVDIQHEFKIYGKPDGENLNTLLDNISKPIVSTLHTVNPELPEKREVVFSKLVNRSDAIFVFSSESKEYLISKYKITALKIEVIPHGVPEIDFTEPIQNSERTGFPEIVFISTGYMRNTKGYEIALQALTKIKSVIPKFQYLIVGSNHPRNETAQDYRKEILNQINDLSLVDNVKVIGEYQTQDELIKLIQLADVCLVPYTRKEQSSSGVLALMLASGRPIVSTPFQFASSIINNKSGVLSNSFQASDFSDAILAIMDKREHWSEIMLHNHQLGSSWSWDNVAQKYLNKYRQLIP
ncbi:MAG: glycosyltransferase [Bacteroidota bacterium]|nr:glycosyltransferase [Bacteroidota bacterium]